MLTLSVTEAVTVHISVSFVATVRWPWKEVPRVVMGDND